MKNLITRILQKALGFDNYLFLFSILCIKTIKINPDEGEFIHFVNIVPDEGVILDIGANIGITTVPLATDNPNAKIYSFEPMPENIRALKTVVGYFKLKNVRVFETALGEKADQLKMVMPVVENAKMQGFSHIAEDSSTKVLAENEVLVPVQKLDEITELTTADKISGIKIDVENFEYFVLKGGYELLKKHKPLIYTELWENERKGWVIEYLKELGYEMKIYDKGQLFDPSYDPSRVNFFFIQKTT